MAINFPSSPNVNDTHTHNGKEWTWNGTSWVQSTNASNYTLPIATAGALGGIRVGNRLTIDSSTGVLDADVQGGSYGDGDVDTHLNQSNPTSGHVLSWNGSDYAWVAQTTDTNTQLTTEQVQDIVGAMVDGGTETRIGVTYDDTAGKLNFVADDQSSTPYTNSDVDTHLNQSNPTSGYVLAWNGSDYTWVAQTGGGSGGSGGSILQLIQEIGPSGQISAVSGQGSNAAWIDVIDKDITITAGANKRVKIEVNGEPKLDGFRTMRYEIRLIRTTGGTATTLYEGFQGLADSSDNYSTMNGVLYLDTPGAGTHNYKYQFRQVVSWNSSTAKVEPDSMVMLLTEMDLSANVLSASDVDTHLNQSNPTSGHVLSWNGSDYAWVAQTTDTNTQLSTEQVQDIVGAMFSGNTETRITATYEDSDGTIDLVVDDMNDTNTNDYVSSASLSGNTLTLGRTGSQSLADLTVDLSSLGGGGASVTVSDNAPSGPSAGDLWWDSDNGRLKVYYTDATPDSQWVDASPLGAPSLTVGNTSIAITDTGSNGNIAFNTEGTDRWKITSSGHIIPYSNAAFDIGNAEYKVRHLFLSDNSLKFVDDNNVEHALSVNSNKLHYEGKEVLANCVFTGLDNNDTVKYNGTNWVNVEFPSAFDGTLAGDLTVDTNVLKVDTAQNQVGIGTASPNSLLHLYQPTDAVYITFGQGQHNTNYWVGTYGTTAGFFIEQGSSNNNLLTADASDYVSLYGAGTKRFETTASGVTITGDISVTGSGLYNDGALDARINTATATSNQLLSWTGSDYDWIDAPTPAAPAFQSNWRIPL